MAQSEHRVSSRNTLRPEVSRLVPQAAHHQPSHHYLGGTAAQLWLDRGGLELTWSRSGYQDCTVEVCLTSYGCLETSATSLASVTGVFSRYALRRALRCMKCRDRSVFPPIGLQGCTCSMMTTYARREGRRSVWTSGNAVMLAGKRKEHRTRRGYRIKYFHTQVMQAIRIRDRLRRDRLEGARPDERLPTTRHYGLPNITVM